jgi:hypothetical protein
MATIALSIFFVILEFNNRQIPLCQFLVVQATRLNMSLNGGMFCSRIKGFSFDTARKIT